LYGLVEMTIVYFTQVEGVSNPTLSAVNIDYDAYWSHVSYKYLA